MKHIQKIGTPDPSKIVVEEKTLKEITEMDKYGYFKIVKIKDVYFTGYDSDGKKLNDEIFPFPSDGKNVTVHCSASDTLLKDTDWFKENRTCPDAWK